MNSKLILVPLLALAMLALLSHFDGTPAAASSCSNKKNEAACRNAPTWRHGGLSHYCKWSKDERKCREATDSSVTPGSGNPGSNPVGNPGRNNAIRPAD
jgi:hypothetical protein